MGPLKAERAYSYIRALLETSGGPPLKNTSVEQASGYALCSLVDGLGRERTLPACHIVYSENLGADLKGSEVLRDHQPSGE